MPNGKNSFEKADEFQAADGSNSSERVVRLNFPDAISEGQKPGNRSEAGLAKDGAAVPEKTRDGSGVGDKPTGIKDPAPADHAKAAEIRRNEYRPPAEVARDLKEQGKAPGTGIYADTRPISAQPGAADRGVPVEQPRAASAVLNRDGSPDGKPVVPVKEGQPGGQVDNLSSPAKADAGTTVADAAGRPDGKLSPDAAARPDSAIRADLAGKPDPAFKAESPPAEIGKIVASNEGATVVGDGTPGNRLTLQGSAIQSNEQRVEISQKVPVNSTSGRSQLGDAAAKSPLHAKVGEVHGKGGEVQPGVPGELSGAISARERQITGKVEPGF
ncbi:MAG TPA: hypothetical protein PKD05_19720, partial [Candidatus Melainabacteria bacterium]|nr:hypothetical protein [Candidatus Melainabacteria bacterium]